MAFNKRKDKDSKYVRLTGMWESKKEGLFTGRLRAEDIDKLSEKVEEAKEAGVPLVFFLWQNEKDSRKDPDFTLQVALGEEEEGGRKPFKKSFKKRDEEEEEDEAPKKKSKRDEEEEEEEAPKKKSSSKGKDW